MPNYASLFESVGVVLKQKKEEPYFGAYVSINQDGTEGIIQSNPKIGSPAYTSGLSQGDVITNINDVPFSKGQRFADYLKQFAIGDSLQVNFSRFGNAKTATLVLTPSPSYSIKLMEDMEQKPTTNMLKKRKEWLKSE